MLVLSRKSEQGIWIGDVHVICYIEGSRVRLAIQAPPHVHILRDELMRRDNQERKDGDTCGGTTCSDS